MTLPLTIKSPFRMSFPQLLPHLATCNADNIPLFPYTLLPWLNPDPYLSPF